MTTTHLNDLFDQMEREKGNKLDDKIKIESDPVLSDLFEKIKKIDEENIKWITTYEMHALLNKTFPRYLSKDISRFTLALTDEFIQETLPETMGDFVNYLVQNSEDQEHTINIAHLSHQLTNIGDRNNKNITINGDVGNELGTYMRKGKIHVYGSAGDGCGRNIYSGSIIIENSTGNDTGERMEAGEIIVKGNTGNNLGTGMRNGKIDVKGNAGAFTGKQMYNGMINVDGDIGTRLGYKRKGGRIYHKHKKIAVSDYRKYGYK